LFDLPDLLGDKKSALDNVAAKKNSIRYLRSKLKSSELQSYQVSDVAAIVANPYTGPVSFKNGISDDGPTIHIVMLSKKLFPLVKDVEILYIDGVFKVVANLQVVLLGMRSPGKEYLFQMAF